MNIEVGKKYVPRTCKLSKTLDDRANRVELAQNLSREGKNLKDIGAALGVSGQAARIVLAKGKWYQLCFGGKSYRDSLFQVGWYLRHDNKQLCEIKKEYATLDLRRLPRSLFVRRSGISATRVRAIKRDLDLEFDLPATCIVGKNGSKTWKQRALEAEALLERAGVKE